MGISWAFALLNKNFAVISHLTVALASSPSSYSQRCRYRARARRYQYPKAPNPFLIAGFSQFRDNECEPGPQTCLALPYHIYKQHLLSELHPIHSCSVALLVTGLLTAKCFGSKTPAAEAGQLFNILLPSKRLCIWHWRMATIETGSWHLWLNSPHFSSLYLTHPLCCFKTNPGMDPLH